MTGVSKDELEQLTNSLSSLEDNSSEPESDNKDSGLPEKYRGKSVEEIIEMHKNAEREIGRLGNQLGEQRELVNTVLTRIESKRKSDLDEPDDDPVELTPEALLDNPKETLERWLRSKTKKKAGADDAESDRIRALEQQIATTRLQTRHPDYVEVSNSPEFVEWLNNSPSRMMTAQSAVQGNVDAAIAILDEFKASRKGGSGKSRQGDEPPALERSGGNSPEPGQGRGKKYSRRAIRALAEQNPAKYEQLLPQIRAAYERGDVIDDLRP